MTGKPDSAKRPGDAVFEAIGWESGTDQIERDLLGAYALYLNQPENLFAAFEALRMIGEHWWHVPGVDRPDPDFGLPPKTPVSVPWWVVHLFAHQWKHYLDAATGKTLGEVFGLEGGGQGRHPTRNVFKTKLRDMRLCLEVAHRRRKADRRPSLEIAIAEVADEFGVDETLVKRAYQRYRDQTRLALDRLAAG